MPVPEINVLLIEDSASDVTLIRELLVDARTVLFNLQWVADLSSALTSLFREKVDAVLLDLTLRDSHGLETFLKIHQHARDIPIVILTGMENESLALKAVQQGAQDYLVKSKVDRETLERSLRYAVERKAAEVALSQSERKHRELFATVSDAIVIFDEATHQFVDVNNAAEELYGYTRDHFLELTHYNICAEADQSGAEIRKALAHMGGSVPLSFHKKRDGTVLPVEISACRFRWEDHDVVCEVIRDITARKRNEERILQSERLAAIGQAMTGLAHESGNALQRSQGCLERLALRVADQPEALDLIARVQSAQDHLYHLYEEVRRYAAPTSLDRRPCALDAILQEVWSNLEAMRQERNIVFEESNGNLDLQCDADPIAIGQVFRNILENSLSICPDPLRIQIEWAEAGIGGAPAVSVALRNNGPPLIPEEQRYIFEPFYTRKAHGTGLGMAIARRIVEGHGGQIAVAEDRSEGVEIVINLPRKAVHSL